MPLTLGTQLKAARALAGLEQTELAEASGVAVNTIRRLEAFGDEPLKANSETLRALELALDAEGVECLNHGTAGVRKKLPTVWTARPERVFANPVGDRGWLVCLGDEGNPLTLISARNAEAIADRAEAAGNVDFAKQLRKAAAEAKRGNK